jgi:hypothetical protein
MRQPRDGADPQTTEVALPGVAARVATLVIGRADNLIASNGHQANRNDVDLSSGLTPQLHGKRNSSPVNQDRWNLVHFDRLYRCGDASGAGSDDEKWARWAD